MMGQHPLGTARAQPPAPHTGPGPRSFLRRFLYSSLRSDTSPSPSSFSTTRARDRRAVRCFMMFPRTSAGRGGQGGGLRGAAPPSPPRPCSPSEPWNSSKSRVSSSSCSCVHSTRRVPFLGGHSHRSLPRGKAATLARGSPARVPDPPLPWEVLGAGGQPQPHQLLHHLPPRPPGCREVGQDGGDNVLACRSRRLQGRSSRCPWGSRCPPPR